MQSTTMYPFQGLPPTIVSSESAEFRREGVRSLELAGEGVSPGDEDSGISLQIPSWKGPLMVSGRVVTVLYLLLCVGEFLAVPNWYMLYVTS